ncbi:hypothetical protein [Natronocalculus amylovorans]|uniref:Uncharacterized protein n=1 Tax=Natronocalculus amylovorans TaxID=2917812 RepID=A0AAE3G068_9EURY|nr:hypothetical protein [Natronocalculus amylovorans]MCL9818331.1 hypothetical protein [Natronocalculus amylovorans]
MRTSKRFGEHIQQKQKRKRLVKIDERIREAIEIGNRALSDGDIEKAALTMDQVILPALKEREGHLHWRGFNKRLRNNDTHEWHWDSLKRFVDDSDYYIEQVTGDSVSPRSQPVRRTIQAFESVEAVCAMLGIVKDEMRNYAKATGYSIQTGVLYKTYEFNHDREVSIVSRSSGLTKTLFNGETGEGKSASMSADVEDRYNTGFKIVDIVDTDEFENAVYDIPQQQNVLRRVREDMGLPVDFTESSDYKKPQIEVLAPMTPAVTDHRLPYNMDSDEFVIRPFTIPAADLSKRALLGFMGSVVTKQQGVAIGTAYEALRDDKDDWTLRDLASYVDHLEGLADNFKARIRKLLATLQSKGFIRDRDCPHALNWEDIFRDTETITVFSQALMREREDKLMVIAYLTRSLYHARKFHRGLPDCAGVFRELHEIVGHQNARSDDEREKAIQQGIKTELGYIMRKNRHEGLELLCDTQDFTDLDKNVRKRFNRAVSFLTQDDAIKALFENVSGNKAMYHDYGNTVARNFGKGQGTVFGKTGPNADGSTPFLTPVHFAPPSWHVLDTDEADDGLIARTMFYDREELRRPQWNTDIPDRLKVPEDKDEEEDRRPQQSVKDLHRDEARRRARNGETVRSIRENIPNNPRTENPYSTSTIHGWIKDITPDYTVSSEA